MNALGWAPQSVPRFRFKAGDEMALQTLENNYRACREGIARLGGGGL